MLAGPRATRGWTWSHSAVPMGGINKTLNPDLRFAGGAAVGDVKYKVDIGDWRRSDLYQVVAFAAGCRTNVGCVIGFLTDSSVQELVPVGVGEINVAPFSWDARNNVDPGHAAERLGDEVFDWLQDLVSLRSHQTATS